MCSVGNTAVPIERANSGRHLVKLVSQGKADIITTIIDKFEAAASTHDLRDEGSNVFVLVVNTNTRILPRRAR